MGMAPRSVRDCIADIARAGKITGQAALRALENLEARADRIVREQGLAPADAIRAARTETEAGATAAAAIAQRNALLNLQNRIARRQRISDTAAALNGDFARAIRQQIIAIATPTRGGRLSAEAAWKTRAAEYIGAIGTRLEQAGLMDAAWRGTLEREWTDELYELSRQAAGDAGAQPGRTGNAQARQIASIFFDQQELARGRLNRLGAWIGLYSGYVTRTSHDADTIRRAGFDTWRAAIEPLLSEATFDGIHDRTTFLRDAWAGLATGVHLSDAGGIGFKDPAFSGPANLAGKLSEGRILHFTDAETWRTYQRAYGSGSILEQMLGSFDHAARQEALMARWGSNPAAELEADIRYFAETRRNTQPDQVAALQDARQRLTTLFSRLDGSANRPGSRLGAQIASDARTIESMAKLGMVAFTHLSSSVTKAAELRYQGVGFFERYANFFESIFQGRGRGEVRQLSDLLLAGTEGMHGRLLSQFQPDDTVPGTLSKLATRFFRYSGLTSLLDWQKAGAQRIMARHLGTMVDRDFADLIPEVRRGLTQYDISPREWDVLRQAPDHFEVDGRTHLTPDAATRADDASAAQAWREARAETRASAGGQLGRALPDRDPTAAELAGYRDDLALKLHAYFADVADRAIVTPGIGDRAILLGNTHPGTIAGEALRFVSQFKLWGIAAIRQGLGRELYGGQSRGAAAAGIVQMAIGAAISGYTTMFLKDTCKGLAPRPPNDVKTWEAALIQGGGFGIMADYLFGEYSRFGGNIGESILGPVLGQGLTEIMNTWNAAKEGRAKDIPPEALRIVTNNLPFVNMFYTRSALNYLFLHSLQETMNPGYLRRAEQSLKKRTGQSYYLSPEANHLHTFGH